MDNKTQHTPGPWHSQRPHGSDIPVWGVDEKSRGCVALVNMSAERATEAAANARLIAAAPEMYEALKALHACHRAFSGSDAWTMLDDEARAAAEATIAKAEGR